jgi:hypothetical protein
LLTGILLVVLSFAWPMMSTSRSGWTDEKAVEYQAASADMHRLSMRAGSTAPENQTRTTQNDLADAKAKYATLRSELDSARSQPAWPARGLLVAGVLLIVGSMSIPAIAQRLR